LKRDSTFVGAAAVLFALLTFIGMIVIAPPGGDYKESDITDFIAHGHRTSVFVGLYLMFIGAICLLYLVNALRARVGGRWAPLYAGVSTAAGTAWAIGAVLIAVVPIGLANGAGTAPDAHTVYFFTQAGFATLFGAGAILLGVALIAFAASAALPMWLRVVTYIAGIAGLLSPAFFPFFLLLIWGIVFGIWTLVASSGEVHEPITA
jgi:hypothetical protein